MPTPDDRRSGVLSIAWATYRNLSGSRDVRALIVLGYLVRDAGTSILRAGQRMDYWATRWSLYRDHGYTLRTVQRKEANSRG